MVFSPVFKKPFAGVIVTKFYKDELCIISMNQISFLNNYYDSRRNVFDFHKNN